MSDDDTEDVGVPRQKTNGRTGTMARRESDSNASPRNISKNEEKYRYLSHGDPRTSYYDSRPQPTRSGGPRHRVLSRAQFGGGR